MTLKAILVDDEIAAIRSLQFLLENYCKDVEVVGTARSAGEGIELATKFNPDIIFLDIEMPTGSGFELLEQLPGLDCQVIFVTAYNKYAVRAFKYSAVDYLLKPIDIEELENAIQRVVEQKSQKINPRERYSVLFENIREVLPRKLVFPEVNGYSYVDLQNVLYVDIDNFNFAFSLDDGTVKQCSCDALNISEILTERGFQSVSPSCMVNLNMVHKVDKSGNGSVILNNGLSLPLDKVKKDDFINKLLWFSQNREK